MLTRAILKRATANLIQGGGGGGGGGGGRVKVS